MGYREPLYYFDVGVYQTIQPIGFADTQAKIDGAALETILLQSIRAINEYYEFKINEDIYETDFIKCTTNHKIYCTYDKDKPFEFIL